MAKQSSKEWKSRYALIFLHAILKNRRYNVSRVRGRGGDYAVIRGIYRPKLWVLGGLPIIGLKYTSSRAVHFTLKDDELVFDKGVIWDFDSKPDKGQLRFKQDVERTWRRIQDVIANPSESGDDKIAEDFLKRLGGAQDAEKKAEVIAALCKRFNVTLLDALKGQTSELDFWN
jgi:hypothetical protein